MQSVNLPGMIDVISRGTGDSGDILISANVIEMDDGSLLNNSTAGSGSAGIIKIESNQLQLNNGAAILSGSFGQGAAGDIFLNIDGPAFFDGIASNNSSATGLSTITRESGPGGDIHIEATNLYITNGARIFSSTNGTGDAGTITLEIAETFRIDGINPNGDGRSIVDAGTSEKATGNGNNLRITATNIEVTGGAQLSSSLSGTGKAGNIILDAETVLIQGPSIDNFPRESDDPRSAVISNIQETGRGEGGDIVITADNLIAVDGGVLDASVLGKGAAGDIILTIAETARFDGVAFNGLPSGVNTSSEGTIEGTSGGNISIDANNLEVLAGAQLVTTAFNVGDSGNISLNIAETARFDGTNPILSGRSSGAFSSTEGTGNGSDIHIDAETLTITDQAILIADSFSAGDAGNIFLRLHGQLTVIDGKVRTSSDTTSGGRIDILAQDIHLWGDSDIRTDVEIGEGRGGDITLTANTIVALNDSDILAFSADGAGGNVLLETPAFFGQNFQPSPQIRTREELEALDGNSRVDVNATGRIASGTITIPEPNFIENSLTELPSNLVNTETLIAGSCVNRTNNTEGSFVITGRDGTAQNPENNSISLFPTNTVRTLPDTKSPQTLQEPEAIYQLASGRLVLSRECGNADGLD